MGGGGITKNDEKSHFWGVDISACVPPTQLKISPKCLKPGVLCNDSEYFVRGGQGEQLES